VKCAAPECEIEDVVARHIVPGDDTAAKKRERGTKKRQVLHAGQKHLSSSKSSRRGRSGHHAA